MEPADSIRRLGFARWYEQRLLEGHAWFVSSLLCMIAIAASFEALTTHGSAGRLVLHAALIAAALIIGIHSLVRYLKILAEAQTLGERATCPACGAYGRISMISAAQVRCRKCDNEWCLIQRSSPFERSEK